MNKSNLIIVGAGGHARSCIDIIENQNNLQIVGLVSLINQIKEVNLGYPIIGIDSDLPSLAKMYQFAFIGIGQLGNADRRINLYNLLVQLGFKLPTIISPTSYISKYATLGNGTIAMHGATINAGASIGVNCIINSHALVEHDSQVGDHCHISTGVILNGSVEVGCGSFIGSGSKIKHGIRIGRNCVVGMGVTVRHDLADDSHFTGER